MSIFESLNNSSNDSLDKGKEYVNKSYEYYKLKAFYILTHSLNTLTKTIFIGGLFSVGMLFFSIALAIFLGNYFNNFSLGFLAVGGIFIFFGLIIFLMRKNIEKNIIKVVKKLIDKEN